MGGVGPVWVSECRVGVGSPTGVGEVSEGVGGKCRSVTLSDTSKASMPWTLESRSWKWLPRLYENVTISTDSSYEIADDVASRKLADRAHLDTP